MVTGRRHSPRAGPNEPQATAFFTRPSYVVSGFRLRVKLRRTALGLGEAVGRPADGPSEEVVKNHRAGPGALAKRGEKA